MTDDEFYAAIADYKSNNTIEHAAKGSTWKNHKYIRIENGKYIYPGDEKSGSNSVSKPTQSKESAKKEAVEYFKSNGGTYKSGDNSTIFKEKFESVGLTQKDLSEAMGKAKDEISKEREGREAMNKAKAEAKQATEDYKKKLVDEKAKSAVKKELDLHEQAAQKWKEIKETNAKKEQQARQEETKKITSLSPDEARKRAAELTKQNTPEKPVSSNPKVKEAYEEFSKYVPDSKKDWNGEWDKVDAFVKEKGLNDEEKKEFEKLITQKRVKAADGFTKVESKPVSLSGNTSNQNKANEQLEKQDKNGTSVKNETTEKERSKYDPIPIDKLNSEQLSLFKEMARENLDAMHFSAKEYQRLNGVRTKVVITKTDPYTGAATGAKVVYEDRDGREHDTGYFFKDLERDVTLDNLERRDSANKLKHSDPRAAFYAAVYNYKQSHKR